MRTTFDLASSIELKIGDSRFDLHNEFDFIGYEYHASERKARLDWRRGDGDWVHKTLPMKITLNFEGVINFVSRRRNDEMPFTEDTCVASISFLPPMLNEIFGMENPGKRSDDEHLSIEFQSGSALKIWAVSATHEIAPA